MNLKILFSKRPSVYIGRENTSVYPHFKRFHRAGIRAHKKRVHFIPAQNLPKIGRQTIVFQTYISEDASENLIWCQSLDAGFQNDREMTDLHKVFACAECHKRPYRDRRTGR